MTGLVGTLFLKKHNFSCKVTVVTVTVTVTVTVMVTGTVVDCGLTSNYTLGWLKTTGLVSTLILNNHNSSYSDSSDSGI